MNFIYSCERQIWEIDDVPWQTSSEPASFDDDADDSKRDNLGSITQLTFCI